MEQIVVPTKDGYLYNKESLIKQMKEFKMNKSSKFLFHNGSIIVMEKAEVEDVDFEEL